jgi:pseudouridine synthase
MARKRPAPQWLLAAKANRTAPGSVFEASRPTQLADAKNSLPLDWLARALVRCGALLKEEVGDAIAQQRVAVDGSLAKTPLKELTSSSRVSLDGVTVDVRPTTVVFAFHKPKGLVSHRNGRRLEETVFDGFRTSLRPPYQQRSWHAVGRLDKDTTGALLFTNDEQFVAFATSPQTHLPKHYLATVSGEVTDAKLEALSRPMDFQGVAYRAAHVSAAGPKQLLVTLTEGKFHQVKRMLASVHLPTLALHRQGIGGYQLDVDESCSRLLTDSEVKGFFGYQSRGTKI